jgi:hypothetical protein
MAIPMKRICIGVPLAAVLLFIVDWSTLCIGDGAASETVTVRHGKPFRLRRVTYQHFGDRASVEECLRFPEQNAEDFREAIVESASSFVFDVPVSTHFTTFHIAKNRFHWRPFAVFRIETDAGKVHFIGVEVPDVRQTREIAIDLP